MYNNDLTTLPEGIFQGLTALEYLNLNGNSLDCLPSTSLVEVDDNASVYEDGLHVDAYGDECGCSIEGVMDNVCGEETCTPGDEGYTCGATISPVPAPASGTATPESAPQPTPVPGSSSEGEQGASTVVVVVGVVAGALALAALGFFLRRRRAAKSMDPEPSTPPSHGGESLEHGRGGTHQQQPQDIHSSSAIIVGFAGGNVARGPAPPTQQDSPPPPAPYAHDGAHQRDALPPPSPHRHDGGTDHRDAWPPAACQQNAVIAAETKFGEDGTPVQSLFPAPPVGSLPKHSSERNPKRTRDQNESGGGTRASSAVRGRGRGDAAEDSGGFVAEAEQSLPSLMTTNSTAGVSTANRTAEVAGFGFSTEERDDGAPSAAAPAPAPAGGRRQTSSEVGYGQAVLAAAEELAHHCQIPGVSEAATAVSILIHLVLDSRDLTSRGEAAVKRCRSIVTMLERAAKVLGKGCDTSTEEERVLMEEVHDAVSDLVELIKTYQNKSKLAQVLTSTLFKRRQDELNAVLDRAIWSLHLGLQVQVGHNVAQVGHDRATGEAQAESLVEARRSRRQHRLDQIEIPEDHLSITNEMLGKGGFGVVYLADYNGHNAAAKVQHITHGLGKPGENDVPLRGPKSVESDVLREKAESKAFLRELDAMIRLRNPHTVNVYGAITSLPDRLVLVMELLAGGDLRAMLKNSEQPLPEDKCRQIIQDVCAGMAFLHSKATVHGDLKSANVLLDGLGRAKACWASGIGDFGTSRWAQNTERSTGLATYTTHPGPGTHISYAWTAPEVLESKESSKASDVYSFGMVAWEVLTRQTPWADQARPRDIYLRVVMREERPVIPADVPVDIAEMVRSCWAQEPEDRPTFPGLWPRRESPTDDVKHNSS
ncbi:unnamed protein product [Ectocarpus sp. 12 AP-2014]